jgi:hypothetical protein
MTEMVQEIWPVGSRVSHFNGKGGHGFGEIIAHNQPNGGFEHFESGIKALREINDPSRMDVPFEVRARVNTIVTGGMVGGLYSDGSRFPYKVRWDQNPKFFEEHPHLLKKFPNQQYEDNYEQDCLTLVSLPKKQAA